MSFMNPAASGDTEYIMSPVSIILLIASLATLAVSAPPPSTNRIRLAFAANLTSGGTCHPSAPEGADLFLGILYPDTGMVTDIRPVAEGPDAQWQPAFSADGWTLTYLSGSGAHARRQERDLATFAPPLPISTPSTEPVFVFPPGDQAFLRLNLDPAALRSGPTAWTGWAEPPEPITAAILEMDPDFRGCDRIGLITPAWAGSNTVVTTAVGLHRQPNGIWRSLLARLFILQLDKPAPRMIPVRFSGFEHVPFPIQACTSATHPDLAPWPDDAPDVLRPQSMASVLTPLSNRMPSNQAPTAYVVITARPVPSDSAQPLAKNETAFNHLCDHVRRLAHFCASNHMPWMLQVEPDFAEAVLRHGGRPLNSSTAEISRKTTNLLTEIEYMGAIIGPIASPDSSGNEADAAWLIATAGATPTPVISEYALDPVSGRCEAWSRYAKGLRGLRYPDGFWRPAILAGASLPAGQPAPTFTGLWRPASPHAFFQHDPNGPLLAVGDRLIHRDTELVTLLDRRRRDELPTNGIYIVRFHLTLPDLPVAPDFENFLTWRFRHLLHLRRSGEVELTDYLALPRLMSERGGTERVIITP